MRRVEAAALTAIADYRLSEARCPSPADGEVLIRVSACGVGYVDALLALGRYHVKPPLPHTPGQEIGGWIESVGPGVNMAAGTRVMAAVRAGFAEFAVASASNVTALPTTMSLTEAAIFRVNYLTALHALSDRGAVRPGQTLVVLGAGGGVGLAAVQVGRLLGAEVVAVASTEAKRQAARDAGADAELDTSQEGWRERLKAACGGLAPDVIFDPVGGPLFEPAFRSLGWGGRHLVVGFAGGRIPSLAANLPLMKGAALVGVDVRQFLSNEPEVASRLLQQLLGWVADGRLRPPTGRVFPFDDFREVLEFALSGQGVGKSLLSIHPE